MRLVFKFNLLLIFILGLNIYADDTDTLSLSISVPLINNQKFISYSAEKSCFYVVIRNTSTSPVKLWEEWCSWGYFCLTFEYYENNETKNIIRKKVHSFTKNYPAACKLIPTESLVIPVYFASKDWTGFKLPSKNENIKLKMRAVYKSSPLSAPSEYSTVKDERLNKMINDELRDVWGGTVYSIWDEYIFINTIPDKKIP